MEDRETIQGRILSQINDRYDKSEGSFFYDSTKPVAIELENLYRELDQVNDDVSLDKAKGDKLTELAYQNGTFRKKATRAIRKGVFNTEVPIGSRFGADDTSYIVMEKIKDFEYKLQCEQLGKIGNFYKGKIDAFEYVQGLESSELTDVITEGVEEESDQQLRERHKRRILEGEQDGNVAQYRNWAERFSEIGAVKVFPLWNGGNTVKLSITNRLYQVADSTLVDSFQEYLDPGSEGLGNGKAPIGSKVTVTGGVRKDIDITGNIELIEGYSEPEGVAEMVSKYLSSIAYVKDSVNYIRIGSSILDTPSIAGLSELRVNGGIEDIVLEGEDIPILNSINLRVMNL